MTTKHTNNAFHVATARLRSAYPGWEFLGPYGSGLEGGTLARNRNTGRFAIFNGSFRSVNQTAAAHIAKVLQAAG